jgi:hypothetical protein
MLSVAAGVALAAGDVDAAVDYGRIADREASELGVEREMPLIRSTLARALLERGDIAGAAERAVAAVEVAAELAYPTQLAICLETAALVAEASGAGAPGELSALLDAAEVIRVRGDRPAYATLGPAVDGLRRRLTGLAGCGDAVALDQAGAARLAVALLGPLSVPAG